LANGPRRRWPGPPAPACWHPPSAALHPRR
jgi:hypothetical protein